ncbi:G-type lectin S-receptor-like serine/threonine-protein kinase At4g27290 [Apium graveolens]|uniref:G-type lectin S-receptor-like serine/threonine-protein kinase At4g27290 n=1 Tax=Apium graveolens TaxID=4045 RepID=UPI003D7BFED6
MSKTLDYRSFFYFFKPRLIDYRSLYSFFSLKRFVYLLFTLIMILLLHSINILYLLQVCSTMYIATILVWSILSSTLMKSTAVDTIRAHQTLKDGDTIISAGGEFELGFFSPGTSTNRYLGIWYKKISDRTVVWVANRDHPLSNTSGVVLINDKGIALQSFNSSDGIIWSVNASQSMKKPAVQLLDTGNLVLRDADHVINNVEDFIWQSFDYPGDSMLPGMKFGIDLVSGVERYYTSWKSVDDPSLGGFTYRLDFNGFPQFVLWKGSVIWSRNGLWNGYKLGGIPDYNPNGIYKYRFVLDDKEIYFGFDLINQTSVFIRLVLTPGGEPKLLVWNDQQQNWIVYLSLQDTDCDRYGLCGAYGICNIENTPRCECLRGFVPKFPEKWKAADWSDGCIHRTSLVCGTKEGFVKYSGVKLPDTHHTWYDLTINLQECKRLCIKNCSCTAYANADVIRGGHGCLLWFSDLTDIREYAEDGRDIYVRMPSSELVKSWSAGVKRKTEVILITVMSIVVLLGIILRTVFKKRKSLEQENLEISMESVALTKVEDEDLQLPLFEFEIVANATSNFSNNNKLGEGGFGLVYKGTLDDGQEIAVKRLSRDSSQGLDEFKNEVSCIAKLQHRNLVTLYGCCTEKGEKILIYEYMANKSLDLFIFDEKNRNTMDWPKRYNIINGIARGLMYLHQDSKLRIIHRDLKASNILLDHELNPKISDFGIARSFGGNETEASTSRVVGTYGYMSPEYAIDGQFSVKSDVYSFGVLLIKIVSGVKNRLFSHPDHSLNLLGHAWMSYKEDTLLQVIDELILESSNHMEVFRAIQIGLLCVQHDPKDRPVMSQVVLMLSSNMKLPHPKQPGFFMERCLLEADNLLSNSKFSLSSHLTITSLQPRQ